MSVYPDEWSVQLETATYRVYLQSIGNARSPPMDIECTSDLEALAAALRLLKPGGWAEVWQGTRFLSRIEKAAGDVIESGG